MLRFMPPSCGTPTFQTMLPAALIIATCSAAGFAVSTSLQHLAAGRTPETTQGTHRLLAHLAQRPWWVLGQLIAAASFGLHALALQLGTLVVVQPVVVSGVVLAVPVRAALARRLPSRSELATVTLTAVGLALFLVAARTTVGHAPTTTWVSIALTAAGTTVAATATWWAGRCDNAERAALWFGVASGVLFGLVAGLVKLTTTLTASGQNPLGFLALWTTWAVLAAGLSGVAINQRAYRAARLSASMPVLNIVDVLVALIFGVIVFGETPAHSPLALAGQLVGFACVAIGLRRLSRSELFADDRAPGPQMAPTDQTTLAAVNELATDSDPGPPSSRPALPHRSRNTT